MSLTFRGCVGRGIKRIRCPPGNTPRIVPAADISSETLLTLLPPPTPLPAFLPYLSSRLGILAGRNFLALIRIRTQGRAPVFTYLYFLLTLASPPRHQHAEIAWRPFSPTSHTFARTAHDANKSSPRGVAPFTQATARRCNSLSPLSFPSLIARCKAIDCLARSFGRNRSLSLTTQFQLVPCTQLRISTPPPNPFKASWDLPTGGI